MYWVRGDGSSSYLSKGKFSTSRGGVSTVLNQTIGWTSRGGCGREDKEGGREGGEKEKIVEGRG